MCSYLCTHFRSFLFSYHVAKVGISERIAKQKAENLNISRGQVKLCPIFIQATQEYRLESFLISAISVL